MPIYDYACIDCGHHFEHMHAISEAGRPQCPSCGSSSVTKLMSTPGLIRAARLHGSGTCCGREERCDRPPCSTDGQCHR